MHNKIYAIPIEVMQGTGEEVTSFLSPSEIHAYLVKGPSSLELDLHYLKIYSYNCNMHLSKQKPSVCPCRVLPVLVKKNKISVLPQKVQCISKPNAIFLKCPNNNNSIQFNSVLFIQRQITTIVISRHLNNMVQFKPIGIQFIVIII